MANEKYGAAYRAVQHIYSESPGRSWQRLNGALAGALEAAILAHLPFQENDFRALRDNMSGGYWMGNSEGDVCGERFYGLAVNAGHTAACISFEKYAGRPPALWAEDVKTATRLCINKKFTWGGRKLTVTSMKDDHLVACSYANESEDDRIYFSGDYRSVEYRKSTDAGGFLLRLSAPVPQPKRRPSQVFKITYAELASKRKEYDHRRKQALADIASAHDPEGLQAVTEQLYAASNSHRHFDIEEFRKAINNKRAAFSEERIAIYEKHLLARWTAGEDVHRYFNEVRLRINSKLVEVSTGQSVLLESVREMLPLVIKHRRNPKPLIGAMVDVYQIRAADGNGIQIGCTHIPWLEVDRLVSAIGAGGGVNA